MQQVDDGLELLSGQTLYAVGIVLTKLFQLEYLCAGFVVVVGLEDSQYTVALLLYQLLAFIDRKVEGSREVGISPGLATLHLEVGLLVAGHGPYDDGYSASHQSELDKQILPIAAIDD